MTDNEPAAFGITPMGDRLRRRDPRTGNVAAVILKHLGSTPGYIQSNHPHFEFETIWAAELVAANMDAHERLGVSPDLESVERIKRHAISLSREIDGLSPPTQRGIELAKLRTGHNLGPHGHTPVLDSLKAELRRLSKILEDFSKTQKRLQSAKGQRNWRAASVAKQHAECGLWRIWMSKTL